MDAYTGFAQVYDLFMDNVPYAEWCGYLAGILREYGIEDGLVLDLGCGTGTLTRMLASRGYDMIGIDISEEMLEAARGGRSREEGGKGAGDGILYICQDMREFELYGTVRAIVCACDSLNYIMEYEDLVQVLKLANNYLDPGGVFVFDLNTPYKYREILGEQTIAENREEGSFIWENYYDEAQQVNQYDLTVFVREDGEESLYRKFQESHYQRGYRLEQMQECLRRAGLVFLEAEDADTHGEVTDVSERIYVVARKGD